MKIVVENSNIDGIVFRVGIVLMYIKIIVKILLFLGLLPECVFMLGKDRKIIGVCLCFGR